MADPRPSGQWVGMTKPPREPDYEPEEDPDTDPPETAETVEADEDRDQAEGE